MVKSEIRQRYWDYYTSDKLALYRPRGVTKNRLNKVKNSVLADNNFWFDVVERHGGVDNPAEFEAQNRDGFEHSIGNFFALISGFYVVGKGKL